MIQLDSTTKGKNYEMLNKYFELDQGDKIQCEYIWIGGTGLDIRAKTRTLPKKITSIEQIPAWNYDGMHQNIHINYLKTTINPYISQLI